jgi:hypothetical protein
VSADLPYVDTHSVESPAPLDEAWSRLAAGRPRRGFEVLEETPPTRLLLAGEHPFSRYTLDFRLEPLPNGGSRLSAATHANFPGVPGRLYRLAVIGTGMHARVVRRMLEGLV